MRHKKKKTMANNLRDLLAMDTLEIMNPPASLQGMSRSMGSTLECFNNMHTGRERRTFVVPRDGQKGQRKSRRG